MSKLGLLALTSALALSAANASTNSDKGPFGKTLAQFSGNAEEVVNGSNMFVKGSKGIITAPQSLEGDGAEYQIDLDYDISGPESDVGATIVNAMLDDKAAVQNALSWMNTPLELNFSEHVNCDQTVAVGTGGVGSYATGETVCVNYGQKPDVMASLNNFKWD